VSRARRSVSEANSAPLNRDPSCVVLVGPGSASHHFVLRRVRDTMLLYAAGTGSAVTDLIFSIAKRDVTFFSGTALISFL
jgi:hypothetical protein